MTIPWQQIMVSTVCFCVCTACFIHEQNTTGWWFGTFFIFPYIGSNHPNWLIFFRGVQTTNQISKTQKFPLPKRILGSKNGNFCCSWLHLGFLDSLGVSQKMVDVLVDVLNSMAIFGGDFFALETSWDFWLLYPSMRQNTWGCIPVLQVGHSHLK